MIAGARCFTPQPQPPNRHSCMRESRIVAKINAGSSPNKYVFAAPSRRADSVSVVFLVKIERRAVVGIHNPPSQRDRPQKIRGHYFSSMGWAIIKTISSPRSHCNASFATRQRLSGLGGFSNESTRPGQPGKHRIPFARRKSAEQLYRKALLIDPARPCFPRFGRNGRGWQNMHDLRLWLCYSGFVNLIDRGG